MFAVNNMGVMICLGQGGLRSLSASSFYVFPISGWYRWVVVCEGKSGELRIRL